MDLPTDPDARIMALRMLGWRLITYTAALRRGTSCLRYYGRRNDGEKETFTCDTAAEAWEWMAETEIGTRPPFRFNHGPA